MGRKVGDSGPESPKGASERFASSLGEPTKPLAPYFCSIVPAIEPNPSFKRDHGFPLARQKSPNARRNAGPGPQGSGSAISIDLITPFVLK